jgi:hypothetical protein
MKSVIWRRKNPVGRINLVGNPAQIKIFDMFNDLVKRGD